MTSSRRVDLSQIHAHEARQQFAAEVQKGESGINLAAAALAVSTEDDALVSHSTVKLPALTFLKRIQVISADLDRLHLAKLPPDAPPEDVLRVQTLPPHPPPANPWTRPLLHWPDDEART
jgi:hypothetical protein